MASRGYWIVLGSAGILGLLLIPVAPWIGPAAFFVQLWVIARRLAEVGRRRRLAFWAPGLATLAYLVAHLGLAAIGGTSSGNDAYGLLGGMLGLTLAWVIFNGVGVWAGLLRPPNHVDGDVG